MSAGKKKAGLSQEDLDKFRKELLEKRREIVGVVAGLEDEAQRGGDDEVSVDHMADHGSDSYEKDQTIGHIERESVALKEIDEALKRIADKDFGICTACGKTIKKSRLNALPSAGLCLDCQIAVEEGRA